MVYIRNLMTLIIDFVIDIFIFSPEHFLQLDIHEKNVFFLPLFIVNY